MKVDRVSPLPHNGHDEHVPPATPIAVKDRTEGTDLGPGLGSWESPAFVRSSRASLGGIVDSAFDPFAEEDGFIPGKGRKRPRFSMQKSDWRIIDEPESPRDRETPLNFDEILDGHDDNEQATREEDMRDETAGGIRDKAGTHISVPGNVDATTVAELEDEGVSKKRPLLGVAESESQGTFKQPILPETQRPIADAIRVLRAFDKHQLSQNFPHLPTETPRLAPVPSPGLPVPSPLITSNNRSGYFAQATTSEPFNSDQAAPPMANTSATKVDESIAFRMQPDSSLPQTDGKIAWGSMKTTSETNPPVLPGDSAVISQLAGTTSTFETSSFTLAPEKKHEGSMKVVGDSTEPEVLPISVSQRTTASSASIEDTERMEGEIAPETEQQEEQVYEKELNEEEEISEQSEELQEQREEGVLEDDYDEDKEKESERESEPDEFYEEANEHEQEPMEARGKFQSFEMQHGNEVDIDKKDVEEDTGELDTEAYKAAEKIKMHSSSLEASNAEEDLERDIEVGGYYREGPVQTGPGNKTESSIVSSDTRSPSEHVDHEERVGQYADEKGEETDEEELYDEEDIEEDYESEQFCEDEDEDDVDSEVSSDSRSQLYGEQKPHLPETVVPEVIVLDSDSEDEVPAQIQHSARESVDSQISNSPRRPDEEQYISDNNLNDSDVEGYSSPVEEHADGIEENEQMVDEEDVVGAEKKVEEINEDQTGETETHIEDRPAIHPGFEEEVEIPGESENITETDAAQSHKQTIVKHTDSADLDRPSTTHSGADSGDVGLTIDPDLFQTESGPQKQIEQSEERHDEMVEVQSIRSPNISSSTKETGYGLFLDGASSPRPKQPSAGMIKDGPFQKTQNQQPVSLDTSQDINRIASDPAIESMLPMQNTQGADVDLGMWSQAKLLPENQPVSGDPAISAGETIAPTKREISASSLVSLSQEELEIKQNSSTYVNIHEQATGGDVAREILSETPESSEDELDAPYRNTRGLRSRLSYFAPLAALIDHFNALTDTISIVHEASEVIRADSGKGDYFLTVQLTDPSMAGTLLPAQIFRRHREALPSVAEGDAILLRDFKVKSFDHSMILVSIDTSAWAVFNESDNMAQMTGPPVEYGAEERSYSSALQRWYQEDGAAMIADRKLQLSVQQASMDVTPPSSIAPSELGSHDSTWRRVRGDSHSSSGGSRSSRKSTTPRRINMHELRGGRKYPDLGSLSDKESIHRLRDGTLYADI